MSIGYAILIQIVLLVVSYAIRRRIGFLRALVFLIATGAAALFGYLGVVEAWHSGEGVIWVPFSLVLLAFQLLLFFLAACFIQGISPPPHPGRQS